MIFGRQYDSEDETMPQTVPSASQSPPCNYNFTAEYFDLSLLPSDGEVPVSPPSLRHLINLFGDSTTSPEPMFSPRQEDPFKKEKEIVSGLEDFDFPTTILEDNIPQLKSNYKTEVPPPPDYPFQNDTLLFDQFNNFVQQPALYPTPPPSGEETQIPTFNIQPCSPYDASAYPQSSYTSLLTVKEEPNTLLSPHYQANSPYPYSPASSYTSYSSHPSPVYSPSQPYQLQTQQIKDEAAIDIEEFLKENQILQELKEPALLTPKVEKTQDYQLLREVLQDTSFQKKFNLKPINLEVFTSGYSPSNNGDIKMETADTMTSDNIMTSCGNVSQKIEPVLSLAIEQMRKDVDNTCTALGISPDPVQWSCEDVKSWILWTLRQYSLPVIPVEYFCMDGSRLTTLGEQDFIQRAPQAGSTLYAQLEIWKAARQEESVLGVASVNHQSWPQNNTSASTVSSNEDMSDDEDEDMASSVKDGQSTASSNGGKAPSKQGGTHIHLWQFLKELLASPQLHGSAIRWLDRGKGVFKIEDSVRVARLWGKRKNRPAMNYDKLSRSIRQYYKKGIMKKTERSQRLVYQFCHPYNM